MSPTGDFTVTFIFGWGRSLELAQSFPDVALAWHTAKGSIPLGVTSQEASTVTLDVSSRLAWSSSRQEAYLLSAARLAATPSPTEGVRHKLWLRYSSKNSFAVVGARSPTKIQEVTLMRPIHGNL